MEEQSVFFDERQDQPERRLYARILEVTWWDWIQYQCLGEEWDFVSDLTGISQRIHARREAVRWFESNRNELGSFLFCCCHLDIDPAAIRQRLAAIGREVSGLTAEGKLTWFQTYYGTHSAVRGSGLALKIKRVSHCSKDKKRDLSSGRNATASKDCSMKDEASGSKTMNSQSEICVCECGSRFEPYKRGVTIVKKICRSCLTKKTHPPRKEPKSLGVSPGRATDDRGQPRRPPLSPDVQVVSLEFEGGDKDLLERIQTISRIERRTVVSQILYWLEKNVPELRHSDKLQLELDKP